MQHTVLQRSRLRLDEGVTTCFTSQGVSGELHAAARTSARAPVVIKPRCMVAVKARRVPALAFAYRNDFIVLPNRAGRTPDGRIPVTMTATSGS